MTTKADVEHLDRELCKLPCDGHFRGWAWLYGDSKIKDDPAKLELVAEMLRKAIFDHHEGKKLNLTYWYKTWYGHDLNVKDFQKEPRDPNCYKVRLGWQT